MSESGIRHQLAGILAADVAGFSRLMAANERATVEALDVARRAFKARIESQHGRVIDMAGDSVLAVFATANGAITAALDIQADLASLDDATTEERRMQFRIGVHLGDVLQKPDGTVYGDGVNIAARLQTKAPPGGICLSQTLYDTVKGKVAMPVRFGGVETFKNIAEPIRVWLVEIPGARPAVARPLARRWLFGGVAVAIAFAVGVASYWSRREGSVDRSSVDAGSIDSKSLAVLPLVNMSDDKDMAYFADGVHEELLTHLALLRDLKVVSRTSVMEYRNSTKNGRQIGAELGVASLLEGSVRRSGNQVRVTAQLIDARSDKHLWAKSYDRELKDIFAIQSELATEIARALQVSLAPQEQTRLAKKPTNNVQAYDLVLRHQELVTRSAGTVRAATAAKERIALLSEAVELDPGFALAWARLGAEHARAYWYGIDMTPARQLQAKEAMDRADALAPKDPQVMIEKGAYYLNALNDDGRAEKAYEEVLEMAPYNVMALIGFASVRMRQSRWAERVQLLQRALAVDPRNGGALAALADAHLNFRHFDRALALRKQLINIRPHELDLQAEYHGGEYLRTGSWDAYDKWRSTVSQDAHLKFLRVWEMDMDRAIVRRDFGQALTLVDIVPEDAQPAEGFSDAAKAVRRAVVLRAKGERLEPPKAVRAALPLIERELRRTPTSEIMWWLKAVAHAILGEREPAFSAHARSVAVTKSTAGAYNAQLAKRKSVYLHALFEERDKALAELARQLKLPHSFPHDLQTTPSLASLWNDPRFRTMVNDPANNAPLAFDLKY